MSDLTCNCGCCGSGTNCVFPPLNMTCQEWLCSGGSANTTDPQGPCTTPVQPVTSIADLQEVWTNNNCAQVLEEVMFNPLTCDSVARAQTDENNLLQVYTNLGGTFVEPTDPGYNTFQDTLIEFCTDRNNNPGGCDLFLQSYCQKFPTRAAIASNSVTNSLCGCYAPPQPGIDLPNPSCDGLCHLLGVAQRPDPKVPGMAEVCSNTVCVIDDVNINLVNSNSQIPVFRQICPACTVDNPCTCIISGPNINQTMQDSGIGPIYQQICGPTDAQCYNVPDGSIAVSTACPSPQSFITPEATVTFPLILIIVIVVIFILAIVVIFATRHTHDTVKVVENPTQKVSTTQTEIQTTK